MCTPQAGSFEEFDKFGQQERLGEARKRVAKREANCVCVKLACSKMRSVGGAGGGAGIAIIAIIAIIGKRFRVLLFVA